MGYADRPKSMTNRQWPLVPLPQEKITLFSFAAGSVNLGSNFCGQLIFFNARQTAIKSAADC